MTKAPVPTPRWSQEDVNRYHRSTMVQRLRHVLSTAPQDAVLDELAQCKALYGPISEAWRFATENERAAAKKNNRATGPWVPFALAWVRHRRGIAGQERATWERLVALGVEVDETSPGVETALADVARSGTVESVEALLAVGANPCLVNGQGLTPLAEVTQWHLHTVGRVLIAAGASLSETSGSGSGNSILGTWLSQWVERFDAQRSDHDPFLALVFEQGGDPAWRAAWTLAPSSYRSPLALLEFLQGQPEGPIARRMLDHVTCSWAAHDLAQATPSAASRPSTGGPRL